MKRTSARLLKFILTGEPLKLKKQFKKDEIEFLKMIEETKTQTK